MFEVGQSKLKLGNCLLTDEGLLFEFSFSLFEVDQLTFAFSGQFLACHQLLPGCLESSLLNVQFLQSESD